MKKRGFIAAAGLICLAAWPGKGEEPVLLAQPAAPAVAGRTLRVWVYRMNPGTEPLSAVFPATLSCRLAGAAGGAVPVNAVRVPETDAGASAAGPAPIPPGGFARCAYDVAVPAGVSGRVWVDVAAGADAPVLASAAPAVATVSMPGAAAVAESASAAAGPAADTHRLAPSLDSLKLFSPYEANYFIYGPDSPTTRFQISVKYPLLDAASAAHATPWFGEPYVAYSQISLWEWNAISMPFYDTSYKPEFFLLREKAGFTLPGSYRSDMQAGLQHESNGKDGDDSRSMNLAYLKPTVYFGNPDKFHLSVSPRVWLYVGGLSDNPDLPDYRGHADLTMKMGWDDGLMLTSLVRAGDSFTKGSVQVDLSYPLKRLFPAVSDGMYVYLQAFTGYGEALLDYDERSTSVRAGFAISR